MHGFSMLQILKFLEGLFIQQKCTTAHAHFLTKVKAETFFFFFLSIILEWIDIKPWSLDEIAYIKWLI